jgi:hypothetical protein
MMSSFQQRGSQFQQLPLFMSPSEIQNSVHATTDLEADETLGDMWRRKETESRVPNTSDGDGWREHGSGVYDSMKEEGSTSHVMVTPFQKRGKAVLSMGEGHHRTAAGVALEREGKDVYQPVQFGPAITNESISYKRTYPQNVRKEF